ncbi:hypothetical protein AHF37_00342, partial [Paragonimus kellicotti]
VLTRGTHVLNFEFKLPADLPSSFELPTSCLAGGASARLYYGLRIEICNNSAQIRHTQQREIIVFRPLELTHFPRLRDRVTLHKEFIISGRCASPNGSILCDMSVNKTGFVPGESITPQVYVTNHSSRAIQTVHLTFAQTVLLQVSEEQKHTEVLRLFAARLKARQPNRNSMNSNNMELSVQSSRRPHGDDNPSLFSSSLSPSVISSSSSSSSSRIASSNKPDGLQSHTSTVHQSSSTRKLRSQGRLPMGSTYFEDVIHVPPLPATGLAGRQQMIRVDYMLVLRLRLLGDEEGKLDQKMQIPITIGSDPTRETSFTNCTEGNLRLRLLGDEEGKLDQKMQIPITIGSDPTRETSFTNCTEVVPCYALFNYASGEVIEYDPSKQLQAESKHFHLSPVYRYFKPRTAQGKPNSDHSGQHSSDRSRFCSPPIHHSHTRTNPAGKAVQKDGYPIQVKIPSKKSGRPYTTFNRDKAIPTYLEKIHRKTDSPCHSPSTLLLARQRFYDDGAQVSVDEQNDENYEEEDQKSVGFVSEQSNQTSSDPNSPISGQYDVQIRQLAGSGICKEPSFKGVTGAQILTSNVRRHGQSPKRQYSFEFYSDQTVSEDESSYQHSSSTFENVKNGALSDSSMQCETNVLLVKIPSKKSGRRTPVLSNPYATDQTSSPLKPAFNRDKAIPTYLEKIHRKTDSPCHSPSTLLLARQRFYDDGAQVSVDEQNDENYEEEDQKSVGFVSEQSNQTSSDPNSPISGQYDVQIRQLAGSGICKEPSFKGVTGAQILTSNVRRHGQSPKRQYSFEFYSDQTVSEDESSYQHSSSTFENVKNGALSDSSMQCETNVLLVRPRFGSVHSLGAQKCRRETGKVILQTPLVHEHMRARSSDHSYKAQKLWIPFSTPAFSTTPDQISDRYKCSSTETQQKPYFHSLQSTTTPTATLKIDIIPKSTDSPRRRTLHHAYWNHPRVAPVPGRIANSDEIWTPGCVLDARSDMRDRQKENAIPVNKGKQFPSPKHIHMQPADTVEIWKCGSEHKIACFSRNHSQLSTYSQHHGRWVAGGLGNIA